MKKEYNVPSVEWVDFNHAERIAASGNSCTKYASWQIMGPNGNCTPPTTNVTA